jgi:hypothetical protein
VFPASDLRFLRGGEEGGGEDIEKLMMGRHAICRKVAVVISRMESDARKGG